MVACVDVRLLLEFHYLIIVHFCLRLDCEKHLSRADIPCDQVLLHSEDSELVAEGAGGEDLVLGGHTKEIDGVAVEERDDLELLGGLLEGKSNVASIVVDLLGAADSSWCEKIGVLLALEQAVDFVETEASLSVFGGQRQRVHECFVEEVDATHVVVVQRLYLLCLHLPNVEVLLVGHHHAFFEVVRERRVQNHYLSYLVSVNLLYFFNLHESVALFEGV